MNEAAQQVLAQSEAYRQEVAAYAGTIRRMTRLSWH